MHRKTKTRTKKTKHRTTNKQKQGGLAGPAYKHRRVSLYCIPSDKEYPISCNICGFNDYIERHTTLGKSKENQAFVNFFLGDTILEDLNNVTIISYFCIKCGMSKIVRGDKDYIKAKVIK